jgi:predicted amidohydrolase YtcJ
MPLAYGSDSGFPPFVAFAQMTAMENPHAVSRHEALAILTRGGAFSEFKEEDKGILAQGMLADLIVLSQDVMAAASSELPKTRSVLTVVGGEVVYDALELKQASVTQTR